MSPPRLASTQALSLVVISLCLGGSSMAQHKGLSWGLPDDGWAALEAFGEDGRTVSRLPAQTAALKVREVAEAMRLAGEPAASAVGVGSPAFIAIGLHSSAGAGFRWMGVNFVHPSCPTLRITGPVVESPGVPGIPAGPLVRLYADADAGYAVATALLPGYDSGPSLTKTELVLDIGSPAFRLEEAGVVCFEWPVFGVAWVVGDGPVVGCARSGLCEVVSSAP